MIKSHRNTLANSSRKGIFWKAYSVKVKAQRLGLKYSIAKYSIAKHMPWIYLHIRLHAVECSNPPKEIGVLLVTDCEWWGTPAKAPHPQDSISGHSLHAAGMRRRSWQCPATSRAGDGRQREALSAPSIALWVSRGSTTACRVIGKGRISL